MELFRSIPAPQGMLDDAGGSATSQDLSLAAAVSMLSPPLAEWRSFRYMDALVDGELFGEVDHFKGARASSTIVENRQRRY
jgi:hypothetical protein